MNEKDFTFFKRILGDAFQVRCLYLKPPYDNMKDADLGFRNLMWGDIHNETEYSFEEFQFSSYRITCIKSLLDFYNICVNITLGDSPELLMIGPFSDHPYNELAVQKQLSKHHFSDLHMQTIYSFYAKLPVADPGSLMSLIGHLLEHLLPDYENYIISEIDYGDKIHEIHEETETFKDFNFADAEELVSILKNLSTSICNADPSSAISYFKRFLPYIKPKNHSVSHYRHSIEVVSAILSLIMLQTSVHPYYILKQLDAFQQSMHRATSMEKLENMATNYIHKCCLLIRNYSYPDYSLSIRNTVSYIDANLQEDLSLTALAKRAEKNPSYFSALFNKEVGCTLTDYVNSARIRASLKYLTTTDLSIAEISNLVGISDFSYFTRIFKKQIGSTPSEYRKLLHQDK